mgnify:CR=1 FL=1
MLHFLSLCPIDAQVSIYKDLKPLIQLEYEPFSY